MQPRTVVIEPETEIRQLLTLLLMQRGHEVLAFPDASHCSLLQQPSGTCSQGAPCSDILIADHRGLGTSGLELFRRQAEKGCRTPAANKLLLSTNLLPEHIDEVIALGFTVMKKPFKIRALLSWIGECETRLPPDRTLGAIKFFA